MAYFPTATKNAMLDAITVDKLSLHTDSPGVDGTANEYSGGSYARKAAVFNAASGSERELNADVTFEGVADATIAWVGLWESDTSDVFHGAVEPTGDLDFNSEGELIVKAGSKFSVADPE
jgi:hypothetical protein